MRVLAAFRYCLLHIFHDWMRTILTIVSVGTIVCVYLLSRGLTKDLEGLAESRFNFPASVLLIMSSNSVFPGDSLITMDDINFYLDLIETQVGEYKVNQVVPLIYRQVYVHEEPVMVAGVAYETLATLSQLQLLEGAWPGSFSEIIINKEYRNVSGFRIGDRILVYGREMTISGICESSMWRNSAVVLSFDQALDLYGYHDEFQTGAIVLQEDVDPVLVQDAIKNTQKDENCCNIFLHDHYNQVTQGALKGFKTLSSIIQIIDYILLSFCAYNAAALVLAEHWREIILIRVNGFSERQVNLILFLRTTIVMLMAFLVGLTSALLIISIIRLGNTFTLAGVQVLLQFDLKDVIVGLLLTIVLTAFSTFISSIRHAPLKQSQDLRTTFMGRVG